MILACAFKECFGTANTPVIIHNTITNPKQNIVMKTFTKSMSIIIANSFLPTFSCPQLRANFSRLPNAHNDIRLSILEKQ
jgi:hypothetical protein